MGVTETLDLYDSRAQGASVIDYGYHLIVADPTEKALKEELPAAFARGVTSFKVFMTYDLMKIDDSQFLDILSVAKEHGALTMVHAENSGIIKWISDRLVAAGHTQPRYHAISHPAAAEAEAINRAITLARFVDAALLIVHVSTPEGAGLVAQARLDGREDLRRDLPAIPVPDPRRPRPAGDGGREVHVLAPGAGRRDAGGAVAAPAGRHLLGLLLRPRALPLRRDRQALRRAGANVQADRERDAGPRPAPAAPVLRRGEQGPDHAATSSSRFPPPTRRGSTGSPARAPSPSAPTPTSPSGIRTRPAPSGWRTSTTRWTTRPFEGRELTGWPVTVLSRGERVVDGGELVAEPGRGRFVKRARPDFTGHPGTQTLELDPARNFGARIAP